MHRQKIHIQCNRKDRMRADVVDLVHSIIISEFGGLEKNILIVVGGPGGTGKSTFSQELSEVLDDSSVVRLDDYKKPRQARASMNIFGAHPNANRMELMIQHFQLLSQGKSIEKPVYNYDTGEADSTESFTPGKYVILDGEVSTYREFEPYIDFSIFIDSDWQTQLHTRLVRDLDEKNYDKDKAINTFLHSNIREFEEYGASSKNMADVHIYCESDYRLTLESMSDKLYAKYNSLLGGEYTRVGLKGLVLAVTTPFAEDGSVDKGAFVEHLQYLYDMGVHRILLGSFSGEFYLLTHNERIEMLVAASRYFPGYITYNVTSFSLLESVEHIHVAEEMGADGVFALPPLVPVGIADSVLVRYFRQLHEAAESNNLTMTIYNTPICTQNTINKSIMRELPEVYVADSSFESDLLSVSDKYLCGGDRRIYRSYTQGGIGFVSGAAGADPELFRNMEIAMTLYEKDPQAGAELQKQIDSIIYRLGEGGTINHKILKSAVSKYLPGYPHGTRSPYV